MTTQLTLRDGLKVDVDISGCGRPVVMVHGWAMNGRLFDGVRPFLDERFAVLSYDLRGHGTLRECRPPTIEQLGADLAEIVTGLDLTGAVLVGWSMGAMVVWEAMTASAVSDRVAGIVSIDMSPRITNDRDWALGLADGRRAQSTLRA
ncbi:MAG: alpha/beta hydrolase, partial [Pseudomonadota bacterium]